MSKPKIKPEDISIELYEKDYLNDLDTILVGREFNLKLQVQSPEGVTLRYWLTRSSQVKETSLRKVIVEALIGDEWEDIYKY